MFDIFIELQRLSLLKKFKIKYIFLIIRKLIEKNPQSSLKSTVRMPKEKRKHLSCRKQVCTALTALIKKSNQLSAEALNN